MNEDRILGTVRHGMGKAERVVGDAIDSERLEARGVVDQVAGAVQNGYGRIKDRVEDVIDEAPEAIGRAAGRAADRARRLKRRGDDAVRDHWGDNGALYLLAGAAALVAIGFLAFRRR
jgi:uncharacterized protein YjbJ (UPF0337 family)